MLRHGRLTTGGIKSDRMMFLCKEVKYQLRMVLHPASVKDIRVNGRVIRQNDIAPHILYIALYGLVVIISLAACLTLDPDNNQSFTAILSSLWQCWTFGGPARLNLQL